MGGAQERKSKNNGNNFAWRPFPWVRLVFFPVIIVINPEYYFWITTLLIVYYDSYWAISSMFIFFCNFTLINNFGLVNFEHFCFLILLDSLDIWWARFWFADDNSRKPSPIWFKFWQVTRSHWGKKPIVFGRRPTSKMAATAAILVFLGRFFFWRYYSFWTISSQIKNKNNFFPYKNFWT